MCKRIMLMCIFSGNYRAAPDSCFPAMAKCIRSQGSPLRSRSPCSRAQCTAVVPLISFFLFSFLFFSCWAMNGCMVGRTVDLVQICTVLDYRMKCMLNLPNIRIINFLCL